MLGPSLLLLCWTQGSREEMILEGDDRAFDGSKGRLWGDATGIAAAAHSEEAKTRGQAEAGDVTAT